MRTHQLVLQLWKSYGKQIGQREFMVKSFKKPVKITLKFIIIVTYFPQSM